ncbi:ras-related protein Rab-34 [Tetranychus urticae]|uniref:Ras-related protein Rab-34 n=1 Tax=Tetranychus urticae TaxID=32264 RepID=T1KX98_TETUR|nr:ras-related protein Rab-34 [Tetranychus urticae]
MTTGRIISNLPLSYRRDATPYCYPNFDWKVIDFCEQQRLITDDYPRTVKCIVVGDAGVGKTSLIQRYRTNEFSFDHKETIGVDFDIQSFSILGLPFNVQIWDTAGQERFRCLTSSYYRAANVALIVFDLSNIKSLANTLRWHADILRITDDIILFLVGSKRDCVSPAALEFIETEAVRLSSQMRAEYWSVSAQNGDNVIRLFDRIAGLTFQDTILTRIHEIEEERVSGDLNQTSLYSEGIIALNQKSKGSHLTKNCCFKHH